MSSIKAKLTAALATLTLAAVLVGVVAARGLSIVNHNLDEVAGTLLPATQV